MNAPQTSIASNAQPIFDRPHVFLEPPADRGEAHDPLNQFLGQIVSECGADGALVIWHADRSQPRTIRFVDGNRSFDPSYTALREQALADLADNARSSFQETKIHSHRGTTYVSSMIRLKGGVLSISMLKTSQSDRETRACRAILDRRLPLLRSFFSQWVTVQGLLAWEGILTAAIDHNDMPTLLLGRGNAIRYANYAAKSLMGKECILREHEGRLECASLSDSLRLQSVIDHVLEHGDTDSPVLVLEREGRRPVLIAVTFPDANRAEGFGEDVVIAYIFDPEQDLPHIAEPACKLYGLLPCEARIACALVEGLSLLEAAEKLHLREQTARSYLKQVFSKTDTNRQAELVQLLLKSSIRLAASDQPRFL